MDSQMRNMNQGEGGMPQTTDVDVFLAARTDTNVLLTGPRAVAKALAHQIHEQSGWRHGPFRLIDCTQGEGLERQLAEALKPAVSDGPRLMQAGTVLLEEIGCMPEQLQPLLADQLEDLRRWRRSRPRILASTSESLFQRVDDGTFDDRLFYRLNVLHLLTAGRLPEIRTVC